MRGVAVPVLESALDRSLQLATSMDARGYGRRISGGKATRRLAGEAAVGGLLLMAAGLYGVIDSGSLFGLGLPVLAVAAVLCGVGLTLGGGAPRLALPTRPVAQARVDRGGVRSGGAPGHGRYPCADVPGLTISFSPLAFPSIPLLAVVGILIALAPALTAPNPIAPSPTALPGSGTGAAVRPSWTRGPAGPIGPVGCVDMIAFDEVRSPTTTPLARR